MKKIVLTICVVTVLTVAAFANASTPQTEEQARLETNGKLIIAPPFVLVGVAITLVIVGMGLTIIVLATKNKDKIEELEKIRGKLERTIDRVNEIKTECEDAIREKNRFNTLLQEALRASKIDGHQEEIMALIERGVLKGKKRLAHRLAVLDNEEWIRLKELARFIHNNVLTCLPPIETSFPCDACTDGGVPLGDELLNIIDDEEDGAIEPRTITESYATRICPDEIPKDHMGTELTEGCTVYDTNGPQVATFTGIDEDGRICLKVVEPEEDAGKNHYPYPGDFTDSSWTIRIADDTKEAVEEAPEADEAKPLEVDENGRPIVVLIETDNTVVCKLTQSTYDELMRVCECGGWLWDEGQLPTQYNGWEHAGEETGITVGVIKDIDRTDSKGILRHNIRGQWQTNYDASIITLQEFYDAQGITPKMLAQVNEYFENKA